MEVWLLEVPGLPGKLEQDLLLGSTLGAKFVAEISVLLSNVK